MAQPLHLTMEGTNPLTMSKWIWVSSFSLGGNLDLENTKLLPKVLELHPSHGFINTSAIFSSITTYLSFITPLYTIYLI